MYFPPVHAEQSLPNLGQFIRANPLGVLTTALPSKNHPAIQSTHIPWVIDIEDRASEGTYGRLRGHLARINPQARAVIDILKHRHNSSPEDQDPSNALEEEVHVLFTHPVQHYVPPRFYVETMSTTRKQAPTWNYAAVQVYGRARFYVNSEHPETSNFLETQLQDLARLGEVNIMGHTGQGGSPAPWQLSDAPERLLNSLRKQIIGIEIEITRLEGKFKMSQELSDADHRGVVQGFRRIGTHMGHAMADLVQQRGYAALRNRKARSNEREVRPSHSFLMSLGYKGFQTIGWFMLALLAYLLGRSEFLPRNRNIDDAGGVAAAAGRRA